MAHKTPEALNTTPVAYGLQNEVIVSDEVVLYADKVQRCVQYETIPPDRVQYKDRLSQLGLILGKEVDRTGAVSSYIIPVSARSLALEEPTFSADSTVYTDSDLIYDLGQLAGTVTRHCDNRIISGPAAEEAFALVDFVHPDERQLYLAPGAENWLSEPLTGDTLDTQMKQFSSHFGDRFSAHVGSFIQGYSDGVMGE